MSFTVEGDDGGNWYPWTDPFYYDVDALESIAVSDDEQVSMWTTVCVEDEPETLSFYWKVSSEQGDDYLQFYIDGELQDQISGEVDWEKKTYDINSTGPHTLKWQYAKGNSEQDGGEDCAWVDFIQWSGPVPEPDTENWDTVTYKYDPAGRRIEKKIDGYATRYCYDGASVIAEYNGNDKLLRKYVYGPGIDQPICMVEVADSNAVYYYHYDGLGSVVALSDSQGDTVQTYEYGIFGQVAAEDPNHTNPYMFTGRRFDVETGLYYYRARYYNPYIGRFLQTDPIGYGAGINLYRYCGNNPTTWIDPLGLLPIEDLPFNYGDPIQVSIAFYDGSDEGYDLDGDGDIDTATGVGFTNAANDFKITVNGQEYDAFFDMSTTFHPDQLILRVIRDLEFRGYEVTDVYFFDHGCIYNGEYILEFGNVEWGAEELEAFGWWIQHTPQISENCTFHFRNCQVGDDPDLLKELAQWWGRSVTGCTNMNIPNVSEESDGMDYSYGTLWRAEPPSLWNLWQGSVECIWEPYINNIIGEIIPNPDPRPW